VYVGRFSDIAIVPSMVGAEFFLETEISSIEADLL
jgi:hypothetical protein